MCRWLAYSGSPVLVEELLYGPKHSLVVQSLHSQMGAEDDERRRLRRRLVRRDRRLRRCSTASSRPGTTATCASSRPPRDSASFLRTSAHRPGRRSSRRTAIPSVTETGSGCTTASSASSSRSSATSCFAVDPALFPEIEGTTDSEVLFYLALTFGLEDDPPRAVERAVGLVEADRPEARRSSTRSRGRSRRATASASGRSGTRASGTRARSSSARDVGTLRAHVPGDRGSSETSATSRGSWSPSRSATLDGAWNEVPESSYGIVQPGQDELHPFIAGRPMSPADGGSTRMSL